MWELKLFILNIHQIMTKKMQAAIYYLDVHPDASWENLARFTKKKQQ